MRLNDDFIVYDLGGDVNMVPTGAATQAYRGIVRCNKTAAFIIECLKTETTEAELLEKLKQKYEGDADRMAENLKKTLNTLRSIHALVE